MINRICHPCNFSQANLKGQFVRFFDEVPYALHPLLHLPETMLSNKEWQHDWQNDGLLETVILESDTDVYCGQSPPIFDAYDDGLISVEKGANLKLRATGSPG